MLSGPSGGEIKLSFFIYEVLCIDKAFSFVSHFLAFKKKCSTWIRKSQHHDYEKS